jgi:outer membrane protein assembly factor BamB
VTSEGIYFEQDIWIGIESESPVSGDLLLITDAAAAASLGPIEPRRSCEQWYPGRFEYIDDYYATIFNFAMTADVCSEPMPQADCAPGEDWPTAAHDMRRTARSQNSTGDARCNQTLVWSNHDAAGLIYSRPVIYDGIVLAAYNNKLQAFDIDDGTLLWTINAPSLPQVGSSFRNSVTVKDGYVYFGGGNAQSFNRANVYTGIIDWSNNLVNGLALNGNLVYTTNIILNVAGTDVVFVGSEAGDIHAFEAATGTPYAGWTTNPVQTDGNIWATTSSNGDDKIYVGTDGAFGTGYGTLYCIDAATGTVDWTVGEADMYGHFLDGDTDGDVTLEIFQGPISVDTDGSMFAMTSYNAEIDGAPDGTRYRIAADGSIIWGVDGKFQRYSGVVIDTALVYFTALRGWSSQTPTTAALKKTTGAIWWESDDFYDGMSWVEGALTCEPGGPDILYVANQDGQFMAFNGDDGSSIFEYNYVVGASARGAGTALNDEYLVMTNRQGDFYVFNNGADRPRLRILTFDELQSVPFFSPNGLIVSYSNVFMNNGCANLTGTLTADEVAPAPVVTGVHPDRISRMQDVADNMVNNSYEEFVKAIPAEDVISFEETGFAKDNYSNMAAYGPPAWLNNIVVSSFDLAEGEAFTVEYNVNGPLVTRGPHRCYVSIASNDQYYLNSADPAVVQLGVLGGCLEEYTGMFFGTTEQNEVPIHTTSEIGNQDHVLLDIDGDHASLWQGGFVFGVDQYRLAFNLESWTSGDPADYWNTTLPEVNCFDQCDAYTTPDPIVLGYMSHDGGATYDAIEGYVSAYAYIDSVVNYNCFGTGWDWANIDCPFDDTLSFGLRVDESVYGVIGEAALNNVVIYRMDMTNRSATDSMPGLMTGSLMDWDLESNGYDVFKFDAVHSISYGASCDPTLDLTDTRVYGFGKIPMNNPMIGTRTLDAQQAMWNNDRIALDSLYYYATTPSQAGMTWQAGIDPNFPCDGNSDSDDREQWCSYDVHDFGPGEQYSIGVYMFGYPNGDITDDAFYADLAVLVNQFAGWGRGDMNNDGTVNLADVVALYNIINVSGTNGPLFEHLADVNADGSVNNADIVYLADYWFCAGPAPVGEWVLPNICP